MDISVTQHIDVDMLSPMLTILKSTFLFDFKFCFRNLCIQVYLCLIFFYMPEDFQKRFFHRMKFHDILSNRY